MQRKYWYLIILIISLVVAIIHGTVITQSPNLFFSWLFVGFWICFTLIFFQKLKYYRQFNSPHNTSFFILGPITIGIFYSLWGYFTGLLELNIFGDFPLYLSFWTLIFAFPYLNYGIFSLYSCFQRYDVIYLGQKAVNARIFGFVITSLIILFGIISLFFYLIVNALGGFPFTIVHFYPDIMLLLTSMLSIFVLIRYGIFGTRPSISEISAATTRREGVYRTPSRTTTSRSESRTRSTPSGTTRTRSTIRSSSSKAERPRRTPFAEAKPKISKIVKYLRPKAGTLSLEDFKCIFCFSLPKYPDDQGRGIVVCPNCKHPAHADEFKEWSKSSPLCSRCDATLSATFRRSPQIIPVKTYAQVIRKLLKK